MKLSSKAKALQTLYRLGRIDIEGMLDAVAANVITEDEYKQITGFTYPNVHREMNEGVAHKV